MGCVTSSARDDDSHQANRSIEELLKTTKRELRATVKTLMLGPGESGKSTVVKQLRLAYRERPWTDEERFRYKEIVFTNTLQSMQAALTGFAITGVEFPVERQRLAAFILSVEPEHSTDPVTNDFNPSVARAIAKLWEEPATKEVVSLRSRFQLNDSAEYFFNAIDRLAKPRYTPTNEDILRTRVRSTGIVEETVQIDNFKMLVVDVGGQRSERKKWIHCFEDVQLLIFVVAISEYDQYLYEDENQPRMTESLVLWSSIANSHWFRRTTVVLFLNKIDLLREKVLRDPQSVRAFLPEYQGSPTDVDAIKMHLLSRFKACHRHQERALFCHFTCATDTTAIRPILAAIMESIVLNSFTALGVL